MDVVADDRNLAEIKIPVPKNYRGVIRVEKINLGGRSKWKGRTCLDFENELLGIIRVGSPPGGKTGSPFKVRPVLTSVSTGDPPENRIQFSNPLSFVVSGAGSDKVKGIHFLWNDVKGPGCEASCRLRGESGFATEPDPAKAGHDGRSDAKNCGECPHSRYLYVPCRRGRCNSGEHSPSILRSEAVDEIYSIYAEPTVGGPLTADRLWSRGLLKEWFILSRQKNDDSRRRRSHEEDTEPKPSQPEIVGVDTLHLHVLANAAVLLDPWGAFPPLPLRPTDDSGFSFKAEGRDLREFWQVAVGKKMERGEESDQGKVLFYLVPSPPELTLEKRGDGVALKSDRPLSGGLSWLAVALDDYAVDLCKMILQGNGPDYTGSEWYEWPNRSNGYMEAKVVPLIGHRSSCGGETTRHTGGCGQQPVNVRQDGSYDTRFTAYLTEEWSNRNDPGSLFKKCSFDIGYGSDKYLIDDHIHDSKHDRSEYCDNGFRLPPNALSNLFVIPAGRAKNMAKGRNEFNGGSDAFPIPLGGLKSDLYHLTVLWRKKGFLPICIQTDVMAVGP